jgi:hypothetical protein
MTSAEPTPYLTTQHGEHYATLGLGVLWLVMPRINANAQEQNGERAAKSAEMWISPDPARQFASPYSYSPNPVNSVDPDGNQSMFIQYGGTNIQVAGGSAAGGVYADFGRNEAGAFTSGGLGNGYQVGSGWELGFLRGGMTEASGYGSVFSASFGLGKSIYRSADLPGQPNGRFLGASFSLGAKAGASVQTSYTKLMSLENGSGRGAHPGNNPLITVPAQVSDVTGVSSRPNSPAAFFFGLVF